MPLNPTQIFYGSNQIFPLTRSQIADLVNDGLEQFDSDIVDDVDLFGPGDDRLTDEVCEAFAHEYEQHEDAMCSTAHLLDNFEVRYRV